MRGEEEEEKEWKNFIFSSIKMIIYDVSGGE
jgi:hypothetical protein